jgi:hypothetical protein
MNGNHYTNDSTPRRGPVKIPVRSISEILEYETLEDIDAEAKKQEEQAENISNEQKQADNKIIDTVVEETAVQSENGDVSANGGKPIANGGQNGDVKHLLQTDI